MGPPPVYLSFEVGGDNLTIEERSKWCYFLQKEMNFVKVKWPARGMKEYSEWITFSFHPASVDPNTSDKEGNEFSTLITNGSFVDLNASNDIGSVINGDATKISISGTIDDEFVLFERAMESFRKNGTDYAGHFGDGLKAFNGYGFLRNNCGGWSKYIVDEAGLPWPFIARLFNMGTAVGGPMHYPNRIIDAFIRGVYFSNDLDEGGFDYSKKPNNQIDTFDSKISINIIKIDL